MVLGGADRYVALVQASAFVALALGVIGVARGLGLSRARGAPRGAARRDAPRDRAPGVDGAERPRRRVVPRRGAVALLLDAGRGTPWLAGGATALAVGTKVTAVFGIPILLVVALLPRSTRRGHRLTGVLVGAAAGAYWYVVNWVEAGSWDAGFPYEDVEPRARGGRRARAPLGDPARRASRRRGRDRWLYLVAAASSSSARDRWRAPEPAAALGFGAVAALLALAARADAGRPPLPRRGLPRALAGGRPGRPRRLRSVATSRAPRRTSRGTGRSARCWSSPGSSSRWSPRGAASSRGSARCSPLAPVYWLAAMSARPLLPGRRRPVPDGADGARRRDLGPRRAEPALAWGLAGIAVTALALAVLNDSKRPSGLPLLERPAPESYWTTPRWQAVGSEVHVPDLIRFVDERVPYDARSRSRSRERPGLRAPRAAVYVGSTCSPRGPATRPVRAGCSSARRRARAAHHGSAAPGSEAGGPVAGTRTGGCALAADAHCGSRAGGGDRTRITSLEG